MNFINKVLQHRFLKFGIVGASGIPINLGILFLSQEYILKSIPIINLRLDLSLGLAIFVSTISNFFFNRIWTWADNKQHWNKHILYQFSQYALGCWMGIAIQIIVTKLLAIYCYYLLANLIAILTASFFNFTVHSLWTFRKQSI